MHIDKSIVSRLYVASCELPLPNEWKMSIMTVNNLLIKKDCHKQFDTDKTLSRGDQVTAK